jgi:hypothetical protein
MADCWDQALSGRRTKTPPGRGIAHALAGNLIPTCLGMFSGSHGAGLFSGRGRLWLSVSLVQSRVQHILTHQSHNTSPNTHHISYAGGPCSCIDNYVLMNAILISQCHVKSRWDSAL